MTRGRKKDWEPDIKPLDQKMIRDANKARNAVSKDLKPIKVKGVVKWVKK